MVPQTVPADFPYSVEELVLMGRFPHAPGRFFESDEECRTSDADRAGKYQDQTGLTLPRL